jgi:hypothetical protein
MVSSLPGGIDDTGPKKPGEPNPVAEQLELVEAMLVMYESKPTATLSNKLPKELEELKKLARIHGLSNNPATQQILDEFQGRFDKTKQLANKKVYPIKDKFYTHSDRDSASSEDARRLGFDQRSEEFRNYSGAGHETEFDVLVYEDGTVKATHVNGVALTEPVEI